MTGIKLWCTDLGVIFKSCVVLLTLVMFVSVARVLYWVVETPVPPVFLTQSYPIDEKGQPKDVFRAGDKLFYFREGNLINPVPRTVYQSLVYLPTGEAFFRLPPASPIVTKKGPFAQRYYAMTLPSNLPLGDYMLRTVMVYQVNPLQQNAEQESTPIRFKVVE